MRSNAVRFGFLASQNGCRGRSRTIVMLVDGSGTADVPGIRCERRGMPPTGLIAPSAVVSMSGGDPTARQAAGGISLSLFEVDLEDIAVDGGPAVVAASNDHMLETVARSEIPGHAHDQRGVPGIPVENCFRWLAAALPEDLVDIPVTGGGDHVLEAVAGDIPRHAHHARQCHEDPLRGLA